MALEVALVAADRQVWSGSATSVVVKTTEGDLGVLTGHAPVLTVLVAGVVQIHATSGETLLAAIPGGFLSVADNRVSVLAEQAELRADIDEGQVAEELRRAEAAGDEAAARRARGRLAVARGSVR